MELRTPYLRSRLRAFAAIALGLSAAALTGCTAKIGAHCVLNTDCGTSGALVCDTSLPNGYCTQFNCTPDVCQNEAACVAFEPSVPGCPYDDYHAPARTTETFCMAQCHSDSDCRQSDGYICADPRQPPWNAAIIDDDQAQLVCIPGVSSSTVLVQESDGGLPDGSVCSPTGPDLLGGPDASADAAADGVGPDAPGDGPSGLDAPGPVGAEGGEAGPDASQGDASEGGAADGSAEGGDAGSPDASGDDAADAGAADAQDEG
jgi:hypothetical protein